MLRNALGPLAAIAILSAGAPAGADLAAPEGPVVLTVIGDITETNRGPLDPAVDKLLAFHDVDFEVAAAFDLTMLKAFGMETRAFTLRTLPTVQELEGPTLDAILAAVGAAEAASVEILALDGFTVDLDPGQVEGYDWILGIRRNGGPLSIGGFGPAWAVFTPAAEDQRATPEEAELWPYQAFVVRVEAE